MVSFNFITIRLGKDSIPDIKKICSSNIGVLNETFFINVKCTQIPDNFGVGDYAFLWLGSDNNKGMPTQWKQGFKAIGRVNGINRGKGYNDTSETKVEIVYVFHEAVNRMDILRCAPIAYYWCSSMPLIGIDDHANQTIRNMSGSAFSDLKAFFSAIEAVTNRFKKDIIQIEPKFAFYFDVVLPNPQKYPLTRNLNELALDLNRGKDKQKPLQQIFYGAPGTGKSFAVDEICKKYLHYRTTFHPDSDYSTFVGCYKPKSHKRDMIGGNGFNETQLLDCFSDSNNPKKYNRTSKARYLYEALVHTKDIRDLGLDAQMIANKLKAKGFNGCAYTTEATCMYNIYDWLKEDGFIVENKLSYEFTPQSFVKAYIDAWKHQKSGEPVFLIIEEINRGNCAQIFGDLFQLLDRDSDGFSRYEILPDTDLQEYILSTGLSITNITNTDGNDISARIANGELMKLPNNLYIWATMNTSDQSLFPIDSAFKRRWEWKYIKIKEGQDVNGNKLNWKIDIKIDKEGNQLSWWEFIKKINEIIASMTSSADKQLGYFFCTAKDGVIDEETFVSKVIFYLWNDVFKDYGFENVSLFRYKDEKKVEHDLTFPDFYDEDGEKVNTTRLKDFVERVMGWKKEDAEND